MSCCHAKDLYWDDVNVILTGNMPEAELREVLRGPPMAIEVHDRDKKRDADEKDKGNGDVVVVVVVVVFLLLYYYLYH